MDWCLTEHSTAHHCLNKNLLLGYLKHSNVHHHGHKRLPAYPKRAWMDCLQAPIQRMTRQTQPLAENPNHAWIESRLLPLHRMNRQENHPPESPMWARRESPLLQLQRKLLQTARQDRLLE